MVPEQLAQGVYRIHADIGDKDLFEGIWPIPHGVSLNAYVVRGSQKTVLVDLVKDWDGALLELTQQLAQLGLDFTGIDYLILNHMEPDHTGALAEFKARNPRMEILCTKKAVPLVKAFYGLDEGVRTVSSGDTLELGNRKLVFEETPNIHWPETMMTFEPEHGILFSCDAFGSFGRYGHCFDDELTASEWSLLIPETERYYANIVSSFSAFVIRGIEKLQTLPIHMIAPSHGIVWREHPQRIVDIYQRLAGYLKGPAESEITLVWSSMYGNTAALVEVVEQAAKEEGVILHVHEVPKEHVSFVLASAWRSSGLILGMPTYEYNMFPPMYDILDMFERKHVNGRKVMRFGSYGWSGGAQKQFEAFLEKLKWNCLGVVEYQGSPKAGDREQAVHLVKQLAQAIKEPSTEETV